MPGFAKELQLVSTPFTNVMLLPTAYVPGEQTVHPPLESEALPTPQGGAACSKARRPAVAPAALPLLASLGDRTPRTGATLVAAPSLVNNAQKPCGNKQHSRGACQRQTL